MAFRNTSDEELIRTLKTYRQCGGSPLRTGEKMGISEGAVRRRILRAKAKGLTEDKSTERKPAKQKGLDSLRKGLLAARPRIWWDDLGTDEQRILLQIKRDWLDKKHRISARDILARCKAVMNSLSVGYEKFRRWLSDDERQEPEE